jgi:glutaredoxin
MRRTFFLLIALLALPWGAASAQRTYKWIDESGNISYRDHPPPPGSGYRVEERRIDSRSRPTDDVPGESAQRAPVVLYSVPQCSPCDAARVHLQKRNVPFAEKNVQNDYKLQQELKQKAGGLTVPTITVGAKVLNTYTSGWLDSELDQAGYPKAGAEPAAASAPAAAGDSSEAPEAESGNQAPAR